MTIASNALNSYNPIFFAQEALPIFYQNLGMAQRVYLGYDAERQSRNIGDIVNIKRPGTFTASSHVPGVGSSQQVIETTSVNITLSNHQEVKFAVSDRELAYSGDQIIRDHIMPAARALSRKVDTDLTALYDLVGARYAVTSTVIDPTFITGPRKILRENNVPLDDGKIHYMIDPTLEEAFLSAPFYSQFNTAGNNNTGALINGTLGTRWGVELFTGQDYDIAGTQDTTCTAAAQTYTITSNASGYAVNSNVIGITASTTVVLNAGTVIRIAGDPTYYRITSNFASGTSGSVGIFPNLRKSIAANATPVVTLATRGTSSDVERNGNYITNLMFHENAFALVFGTLPTTGDGKGAQITSITDPNTGISIRVRFYYTGDAATVMVALDCLYGVQVLDPMLAARVVRPSTVYP